jgi:hypothetical protein
MPVTSTLLKNIVAEARPIIERQLNDAKLIAGFRDLVTANGGDWSALKALIKAQIEDEIDDAGDGKRVRKILDKADCSTAYADMLGLANMNENNFSQEQFDAETGEITNEPAAATETAGDYLREPATVVSGQIIREGDAPRGTDHANGDAPRPDTDFQPLAFLTREDKPFRPHCLNPDSCAGQGNQHCYSCRKAMAEADAVPA